MFLYIILVIIEEQLFYFSQKWVKLIKFLKKFKI